MLTPSNARLARYLASESSVDEVREIEQWIAEDPAHQVWLDELQTIWNARQPSPTWDVPGIWANVRRTMRTERRRQVAPLDHAFGWKRHRRLAFMAAAAAVVLLITGLSFFGLRRSTSSLAPAPVPMREYATARGQRATLQLPDGTRLLLAPASRLWVPATFGLSAREVRLDGEALFDVVHDTTRPFRVRAKHAVAEDIGTRFDIRAYREDSVVAVAVAEGAVALGPADTPLAHVAQGVVLGEGELGTLSSAGQVTTVRGAAVVGYLAWANGKLAFIDTPLDAVALRLGRWYDIDVELASSDIATRRLTAAFTNESAPEALRFVASVLNLAVSQVGDRYTLRAK